MTIEPSLIVWTVLCFFALMLILKKLLFQPMLTFMDTRNAKIEAARKAKEDARTEYEAEARRLADERAAQEAQLRQSDAEALEQAQEELRRERRKSAPRPRSGSQKTAPRSPKNPNASPASWNRSSPIWRLIS